jgi:hypothetical protein
MKINDIMHKLEQDLCFHLDNDVYIPTKLELTQIHSLGRRKEDFKRTIMELCNQALYEIEKIKGDKQ